MSKELPPYDNVRRENELFELDVDLQEVLNMEVFDSGIARKHTWDETLKDAKKRASIIAHLDIAIDNIKKKERRGKP